MSNRRPMVIGVALLGAALAVFAALNLSTTELTPPPEVTEAAGATANGPNVLILLWDTVRADHLSVYGHHRKTTPFLEELAESSLVFDRAISPGMWTPPSHGSMFTGLPPSQHGVNANYKWLDHHHVTLAEWMTHHGYATYAWSANPYVSEDTNLLQGFDTFQATFKKQWKRAARTATNNKLIPADASSDVSPMWKPQPGQKHGGNTHAYKDGGAVGVGAFTKWVLEDRPQDRPFFAYVNLMEAHIPRIPSMASRQALLDPTMIATGLQTDAAQINLLSYIFGKHEYTNEEIEAINGVYDAALLDLDILTRDLIDQLEAAGVLDDTVVILTSDHGENLGDHHMFGHKYSLFDTLLNVPLMIRYPKKVAAGRVTEPVSNLNLYATILDLAELPAPPHPILSKSLLDRQPEPVFSELVAATPVAIRRVSALHGGVDQAYWLRTFKSVESDGWKLIRSSAEPHQLYRPGDDPQELNNLYPDHPEEAAELGTLLDDWLGTFPTYQPSSRAAEDEPKALDAKTLEMLQQMGYMTEDAPTEPASEFERNEP